MSLPPRLPVTARPARHEALASYLRRLATLNSLDGDDLWRRVTTSASGSRLRRSPAVPAVAALAGREPAALAAAIPELRDPPPDWESLRHAPQAGCPRCDAGHPGGQVLRLLPHHEYACTRHQYWIGPPDINHPGPPLPGHPEIITAQRRHCKLVRQHGWAMAYDGVLTGLMICAHLWQNHAITGPKPTWDRRRQDLIPPGQEATQFTASRIFATVYPEAVSLAAVIASPQWRELASGTGHDARLLAAELGRRTGIPGYTPSRENDPIGHWIADDASQPPSPPGTIFRGRRPSQLDTVHPLSQARHDTSALRLASGDRPPGRIILTHRVIQPVLIRQWSIPMDNINGAIWQSQRTGSRKFEELKRTTSRQGFRRQPSSPRSADRQDEALIRNGQLSASGAGCG